MSKRFLLLVTCLFGLVTIMAGCSKKPEVSGSYDFIIYESDDNNQDLSDNPIVVKYHIEYSNSSTVLETLLAKDNCYYFNENSKDYIIMKNGAYGMSYDQAYFENYSRCQNGQIIDVSMSYTAVNGEMAQFGIASTPLDGLVEYGFVIDGWKTTN